MIKQLLRIKARAWLVIVTIVAVLQRVILFIIYRPVSYSDTDSYRRLAEAIRNGWNLYDGTRLPGYPFFMAMVGSNEHLYLAQLILGLVTTLLVFYIGWRISGKGWFGAVAALAHTLNSQQIFFEADLISESLTTFFVVLTLASEATLFGTKREASIWNILLLSLGIGFCGAGAALIRPVFAFLPFTAALFSLLFWRARWGIRWGSALVIGLMSLTLIAAWVNFLHRQFGRWGLDTMTGYHLVQHTGAFFEFVPDQYAALRDTYIHFRDERIAQTGSPANAIWNAIPELEKVSGLSFYDLSDTLAKISVQLIREHPWLYLRSAWQGWTWFWKAPVYWSPSSLPNPLITYLAGKLVLFERGGMYLANIAFLSGSVLLFWKKFRQVCRMDLFLYMMVISIWMTSILQTLPDHGDNPRFSVPVQSIIIMVVLWWVVSIVKRSREAR